MAVGNISIFLPTVITRLKVTDKSPDNEQENRDIVAVFFAMPPPNPNS